MKRRERNGEGSRYGQLAAVHRLMVAMEADPTLRHRLPRTKPRTAEEARELAEARWRMEEHSYVVAHREDALAEAEKRFLAAGGTRDAWAELGDLEIAAYHIVAAVHGEKASTLDVPGFDRGIPSWLVHTGELAGAAFAAGVNAWREFLKLTVHPSQRK